jgi:hypothetical protein
LDEFMHEMTLMMYVWECEWVWFSNSTHTQKWRERLWYDLKW